MVFMSDTEKENCIIDMRIILSITTHVGSKIYSYRLIAITIRMMSKYQNIKQAKSICQKIFIRLFIKSQNQFMQAGYTLAPNKQRKQISQAVLEVELLPHFIELMMMMCFLLSTDKNHQSDKVFYRSCIMKIRLFIFQYALALRNDVLNSIKICIY